MSITVEFRFVWPLFHSNIFRLACAATLFLSLSFFGRRNKFWRKKIANRNWTSFDCSIYQTVASVSLFSLASTQISTQCYKDLKMILISHLRGKIKFSLYQSWEVIIYHFRDDDATSCHHLRRSRFNFIHSWLRTFNHFFQFTKIFFISATDCRCDGNLEHKVRKDIPLDVLAMTREIYI